MNPNVANVDQWLAIAFGLGYLLFYLGCAFSTVSLWLVLVKAKRPGWTACIPCYNSYILNEISGLSVAWFVVGIIFSSLSGLALALGGCLLLNKVDPQVTAVNPEIVGYMVAIGKNMLYFAAACFVVSTIWWIKMVKGIVKAFGKSNAFAVGLFFLYIIFIAILAFDKNIKYQKDTEESLKEVNEALEL